MRFVETNQSKQPAESETISYSAWIPVAPLKRMLVASVSGLNIQYK